MPRVKRKPAVHPWPEGIEPYNVAQKQYICVMALYTKMRWGTIALVLGERFSEVFSQALVQRLFWQMRQRSSQVLTSMEKATKNQEHIKEILDDCEEVRLKLQTDRRLMANTIKGMKDRVQR